MLASWRMRHGEAVLPSRIAHVSDADAGFPGEPARHVLGVAIALLDPEEGVSAFAGGLVERHLLDPEVLGHGEAPDGPATPVHRAAAAAARTGWNDLR